jgi:hypothetical protein
VRARETLARLLSLEDRSTAGAMNDRIVTRRAGRFAATIFLAAALGSSACSGSNDNSQITPSTLATTCGQVCNNVLAQCGIAASVYTTCTNACTTLLLVPDTCITEFAGYLACLTGVTSIQCVSGGQTFEIAPGSCVSQEADYENCNAGPSPIAACVALSSSSTVCSMNAGEGLISSGTSEFCVGVPSGCTSTASNPLGIGTYCCDN